MADNKDFYITDTDKEWVHESFELIVKIYGYPSADFKPILLTKEYFPNAFATEQNSIQPIISDLCNLFNIDPAIISFVVETDIRDAYDIPYEIEGPPPECDLEFIQTDNSCRFKLYYANSILKNPKRLIFNSLFQFIKISLAKEDIEWFNEDDDDIFYLIGIYTGCGVLLAQTMSDAGTSQDGFWETKWKYVSPIPLPVMAYSMALF